MNNQTYLGDGVYASFDGFQIKLYCECMSEPNSIFLEPSVMQRLNQQYAMWTRPHAVEDANEQAD